MPVLSYKYVSSWYHLEEFQSGRKLIVQDWNEDQNVSTSNVELMQGSIGPHVKNIGGHVWTQKISTPVIIFENHTQLQAGGVLYDAPVLDQYGFDEANAGIYADSYTGAYGVLDLLVDYWKTFTDASLLYNSQSLDFLNLYLLDSATLNLSGTGSTLSMDFKSDRRGPFSPVLGYPNIDPDQYIGRTAKPWDVTVQIGSFTLPAISSVNINFKLTTDENYFMFPDYMSMTPYFAVKGYEITGSVTALLDPSQLNYITGQNPNAGFDPYIMPQVPGRFFADDIPIAISYNKMTTNDFTDPNAPYYSRNLILASKSATTKIGKVVKGGDLAQVTINFSCFARPGGLTA